ncbi:hypothetical protein TRIUR3_24452 [Triticum urartu]|uniref:Uncharacterized protein n=1 Tax=Triticum urartu TaxID=4572 RepID=M8A085_TRIUA|nr:hypothetical protein TRIUR3_24452 [Triticum urartu]
MPRSPSPVIAASNSHVDTSANRQYIIKQAKGLTKFKVKATFLRFYAHAQARRSNTHFQLLMSEKQGENTGKIVAIKMNKAFVKVKVLERAHQDRSAPLRSMASKMGATVVAMEERTDGEGHVKGGGLGVCDWEGEGGFGASA